jgi:hypothetical protein
MTDRAFLCDLGFFSPLFSYFFFHDALTTKGLFYSFHIRFPVLPDH